MCGAPVMIFSAYPMASAKGCVSTGGSSPVTGTGYKYVPLWHISCPAQARTCSRKWQCPPVRPSAAAARVVRVLDFLVE